MIHSNLGMQPSPIRMQNMSSIRPNVGMQIGIGQNTQPIGMQMNMQPMSQKMNFAQFKAS